MNLIRWNDGGLLTVAIDHNKPDVLRQLLDYGFDPDERVSYGEGDWVAYSQGYPLWHSAALGRLELAEMLLERGANPNVHVIRAARPYTARTATSNGRWSNCCVSMAAW